MLCLGLNPKCSLLIRLRPLTSLRILVIRIFLIANYGCQIDGLLRRGNTGSFSEFRMEIARAFFRVDRIYYIRKIAINLKR